MTRPDTIKFANPGDWAADANCRGKTHLMVMPDREKAGGKSKPSHAALRTINRGRLVCDTCPVLEPCRAWAMTTPDPAYGLMAGGLTPQERNQKRREQGIYPTSPLNVVPIKNGQACGSRAGYKRHLRRLEEPCDDCNEANNRWKVEQRRRFSEKAMTA